MNRTPVIAALEGGVLTLMLNRPQRLNAMSPGLIEAMNHELGRARDDKDIRAVLLTGIGRGFCAGADLANGGPGDPDAAVRFRQIIRANEILTDKEQRAAYDHLLMLAHVEKDPASAHPVAARIHRIASGALALASASIVTAGGYFVFMHMSLAIVAPSFAADAKYIWTPPTNVTQALKIKMETKATEDILKKADEQCIDADCKKQVAACRAKLAGSG